MRGLPGRKLTVFALGAICLAGALTLAAVAAPERAAAAAVPYTPHDPHQRIASVPPRDPDEIVARQALATSPENLEVAVQLARAEIARSRALSDPRYLGRAQATLAPWWKLADAPADVLLLRATILQSLHEFPAARADLDRLIELRPDDAQAHLTRAVVATVTGDYAAARASCIAIATLTTPLIATTCEAPLDGIAGHADEAYHRLAAIVRDARRTNPQILGWAETALAELAIQRGDSDAALTHLQAVIARDPNDAYARAALADLMLGSGRAADASALLAGHESVDSLLLRRAIAEHVTRGRDAARLVAAMRERIDAAALRGDRIHMREEARFALAVDADPARAVMVATDNWNVQKELADARLLVEAAVAARESAAAAPVVSWARTTGVQDAQLDRWLRQLEDLP